jgi:cell shape-determining protein MreC
MPKRNHSNGLTKLPCAGFTDVSPKRKDCDNAIAEIKRLKLQLAEAREELHELTEATSDFVRLMI